MTAMTRRKPLSLIYLFFVACCILAAGLALAVRYTVRAFQEDGGELVRQVYPGSSMIEIMRPGSYEIWQHESGFHEGTLLRIEDTNQDFFMELSDANGFEVFIGKPDFPKSKSQRHLLGTFNVPVPGIYTLTVEGEKLPSRIISVHTRNAVAQHLGRAFLVLAVSVLLAMVIWLWLWTKRRAVLRTPPPLPPREPNTAPPPIPESVSQS